MSPGARTLLCLTAADDTFAPGVPGQFLSISINDIHIKKTAKRMCFNMQAGRVESSSRRHSFPLMKAVRMSSFVFIGPGMFIQNEMTGQWYWDRKIF